MWPASAFCESSVEAAGNKPGRWSEWRPEYPLAGPGRSRIPALEGARENPARAEEL